MTKLANWLTEQLSNYLTTKQGCVMLTQETIGDTHKLVVQDVFGQNYEVTIKATNRNTEVLGDYDVKRHLVGLSQTLDFTNKR